jgi:hypothetical protein
LNERVLLNEDSLNEEDLLNESSLNEEDLLNENWLYEDFEFDLDEENFLNLFRKDDFADKICFSNNDHLENSWSD